MAQFIVTTLEDETEDNGELSLREALVLANGGSETEPELVLANDEAGADQIIFADDLEGTIRLTQGLLSFFDDIAIDGGGRITISGDALGNDVVDPEGITDVAASRADDVLSDNTGIFRFAGDVTLEGLTLTGGASNEGGAVRTSGTVTIRDSNISGHSASGDGGAVLAGGDVIIENTVLSGNIADRSGGGVFGRMVTITDSTISNNTAGRDGGGIYSGFNGLTVTNSAVTGNYAGEYGGGLFAAFGDITITGTDLATNEAGETGGGARAFRGNFTAIDSTIRGNIADADGALKAVGDVHIETSQVSENTANTGVGVFSSASSATIIDSAFIANEGFYGVFATSGSISITGSLFQDNVGRNGGAVVGYSNGPDGFNVSNSTFVGNQTDTGAAAIAAGFGQNLTLDHVTITGNTSGGDAGAVNLTNDTATATITNSIITSNTGGSAAGPDLTDNESFADVAGNITFAGTNIIGEDNSAFETDPTPNGVINGAAEDIFVSDVADNGGPTPTLALLANALNPAIDASSVTTQTTDARGEERPSDVPGIREGTPVDLGAVELQDDEIANPFEVTTLDDVVDANDGVTSLREALLLANEFDGANEITFADDLNGTIRLTQGTLTSTRDVTIDGDDRITITADALGNDVTDAAGITDVAASQTGGLLDDNAQILAQIDGDLTLNGLTLTGGSASGSGGAIFSQGGDITITDSAIAGNSAQNGGGLFANGGGITITGTTLAGNVAGSDYGAAFTAGSFSATDSVIRDNRAESYAGVYASDGFEIERTDISGNVSTYGAAALTSNDGQSSITDSTIIGNEGGYIVFSSGTVSVTGSLFQGNVGINNGGITDQGNNLTVTNSTFVGNTGGAEGGVISSIQSLYLNHVTITGNTSNGDGGAVNLIGNNARATIANSIITSNIGGGAAGPDLTVNEGFVPFSATIGFFGANIVGEDASAFNGGGVEGDVRRGAAADIFVEDVADNGGPVPTLTLRLAADNPAIDASNGSSLTTDARGGPRPRDIAEVDNGGTVDLGAFELNFVNLAGDGIEVEGDGGSQELLGTDGDDTITGNFEDTTSGAGEDTIRGFGGHDLLDGAGDSDTIFGGDGNDTIIGGVTDSTNFLGQDRVDTIFGEDGDDTIDGGDGVDIVFGGAGDDRIIVTGDDFADDVDGGDNTDTVDFSGSDFGHIVDLETGEQLALIEGIPDARGAVVNVENLIGSAFADTFTGDENTNVFEGGDGDDTLFGGDGDDTLFGGDGADLIEGGDGNDVITGGGASDDDGVDTLFGGDGNDTFDGGFFEDQIFGGAGNDTILINANDFADVIDGGEDIDTVDFSDADADIDFEVNLTTGTIVRREVGEATSFRGSLINVENLIGGVRGDSFTGNGEANQLEGGGGNDTLIGAAGNDRLFGGDGDDTLIGAAGNDRLFGGDGDDTLFGGDGIDALTGGAGNDTLDGGALGDQVFGGTGDDTILVNGDDGLDVIDGGDDTDTVDFSGIDTGFGFSVNLETGAQARTQDGGVAVEEGSIANVENLIGGNGDDRFTGDDQANALFGGDGDDTLFGGDGSDTLVGGAGADILSGGGQEDQIFGGTGNDTIQVSAEDGLDVIDGGDDTDTVDFSDADDGFGFTVNLETGFQARSEDDGAPVEAGSITNVENLIGSSGADDFTGSAQANQLDGGGGDDLLLGAGGDDTLFGGAGADQLQGGSGNDTIFGGDGDDALIGGSGDDVINGGEGADVIAGIAGQNALSGGAGGDLIIGGFDADDLNGGDGNDVLVGDNNALIAAADTLTGGLGDDLLEGGGGADVFVFNTQAGNDTIGQIDINFDDPSLSSATGADFVSGVDQIQLEGFDITTGAEALALVSDVDGVATFDSEGTVITFVGLTVADLNADDFIF